MLFLRQSWKFSSSHSFEAWDETWDEAWDGVGWIALLGWKGLLPFTSQHITCFFSNEHQKCFLLCSTLLPREEGHVNLVHLQAPPSYGDETVEYKVQQNSVDHVDFRIRLAIFQSLKGIFVVVVTEDLADHDLWSIVHNLKELYRKGYGFGKAKEMLRRENSIFDIAKNTKKKSPRDCSINIRLYTLYGSYM